MPGGCGAPLGTWGLQTPPPVSVSVCPGGACPQQIHHGEGKLFWAGRVGVGHRFLSQIICTWSDLQLCFLFFNSLYIQILNHPPKSLLALIVASSAKQRQRQYQ